MCEPLTIAALALTAAGTGVSAIGQQKAQRAQANAQAAEGRRQDRYQQESMGYWQQAMDRSGRPAEDERLEQATEKRGERYTKAVKDFDVNTDLLSGQREAPAVVRNAMAREVGQAVEDQRLEAWRKAILDAWGDSQLAGGIDRRRSGDMINMMGGFARGSADVLPLELQAAQQKGAGMRTLGTALQALGTVTGMAGAGGGIGDIFGTAASGPTKLGEFAAQHGMGPWTYHAPAAGMPGSTVYSIPLP